MPYYPGTLICDFDAVYHFIGANRQRCWAHLTRDIQELHETFAPAYPDLDPWIAALEQTYTHARDFVTNNPKAAKHTRRQMAISLGEYVNRLSEKWLHVRDHAAHAMCQRLRRHEDDLFQFVRQRGIALTNNRAERALRPLVIGHKISGGTRSPKGTQAHVLLHSLATTWAARGLSMLDSFRGLLSGVPPVLGL